MINAAAIREWSKTVPWKTDAQIEQDLLISRALSAIFSDEFLSTQLAFRGGTALHKLYLKPQMRYSEDIDLVQINPGPIKPIMYRMGEVLNFMPNRITKQKRFNNTMVFRLDSEMPPVVPLRIKCEINCFEHFNELGLVKVPFSVRNQWFSAETNIVTYQLEELIGTKMRALYQRKKGRDLFDLYMALTHVDLNLDNVIRCFHRYMDFVVQEKPTYKLFVANMEAKMRDADFIGDAEMLLRPDIDYNPINAYEFVKSQLINRLIK